MILLLGDVHCRYGVINQQIKHSVCRFGKLPDVVLQLGDLGFYKNRLFQYFTKQLQSIDQHVYFIDGNHEDFHRLTALANRYARHFTHIPRCTTRNFLQRRFLFLGGASYMDSINTPPGAVITDREIERCLQIAPDAVDIVASHDCPRGIGVRGKADFSYCGVPGFMGSRRILDRFSPRLWFFAHHHEWFEAEDRGTKFYGLAPAWAGYGVLDEQDRVALVENRIEDIPPPQHFFRKWGRLRTGSPEGSASTPSLLRRLFTKGSSMRFRRNTTTPSSEQEDS